MVASINWHCEMNKDSGQTSESQMPRQSYPALEFREALSAEEFFSDYVAKGRAVIVRGALNRCRALSCWTFDKLRQISGQRTVNLKQGLIEQGVGGLKTLRTDLNSYLTDIELYESRLAGSETTAEDRPPYLHDIPLLHIIPSAIDDLRQFPSEYFPKWYRADWLKFTQFFLGPKHSLTPLHFDCLLTHNLFFQVKGRKRFILLNHDQLPFCYRYRWRWCEVNVENPDRSRHPLFEYASAHECIVQPGDMLYLPPGMLHHVRSLDSSISFNVDWHTQLSAIKGVTAVMRGMPIRNVYYNTVLAVGQSIGISADRILPLYRSYLNYVS